MTVWKLSRLLRTYQIASPFLEALNLLELATGLPRTKIVADDFKLNSRQMERIQKLAERRRSLPLAYLSGRKEFYGLDFYVDREVLIPRPASEDLLDLSKELGRFSTVYDLGCGSGCLGISYARSNDCERIYFLDYKTEILKIAQTNARRHQLASGRFKLYDLRTAASFPAADRSLVIANLPYLDAERKEIFEARCPDLKSEPTEALYAKDGGLEFYQLLFKLCRQRNLTIVCETLKEQQPRLTEVARENGFQPAGRLNLASAFRWSGSAD